MGPLAWGVLVAILVVYPILQVPLVLYLSRYVERDGDGPLGPPTPGYPMYSESERQDRSTGQAGNAAGSRGVCPDCGTHNGTAYVYCQQCLARLAPR
jgi:hypothetical protein